MISVRSAGSVVVRHRHRERGWVALFAAMLVAGSYALGPLPVTAEDLLASDEQVARFEVCYDFGCATTKKVYIFDNDFQPVRALLLGASGADDERRRIARAVGAMERLVATMTPTGDDLAGNGYEESVASGQMDCIDESTNTSRYLSLFQSQGLLKFHQVSSRIYRAPALVDEHWSAQIRELGGGRAYAVDSWHRANGEPAVIQPVEDWLLKKPIPGR